mmetsp:Transcript_9034/g.14955  ORF Transcript_9034/g.14955 Transcript_9034/m.14955 type:complete len:205 (+) Transcript_9034:313-927(+)
MRKDSKGSRRRNFASWRRRWRSLLPPLLPRRELRPSPRAKKLRSPSRGSQRPTQLQLQLALVKEQQKKLSRKMATVRKTTMPRQGIPWPREMIMQKETTMRKGTMMPEGTTMIRPMTTTLRAMTMRRRMMTRSWKIWGRFHQRRKRRSDVLSVEEVAARVRTRHQSPYLPNNCGKQKIRAAAKRTPTRLVVHRSNLFSSYRHSA